MTPKQTFSVTVWDHSLIEVRIRATSAVEAQSIALCKYADARSTPPDGFQLLDNYDEEWEVRPTSPKSRRKGRGGAR
jgi:hypothetical protein